MIVIVISRHSPRTCDAGDPDFAIYAFDSPTIRWGAEKRNMPAEMSARLILEDGRTRSDIATPKWIWKDFLQLDKLGIIHGEWILSYRWFQLHLPQSITSYDTEFRGLFTSLILLIDPRTSNISASTKLSWQTLTFAIMMCQGRVADFPLFQIELCNRYQPYLNRLVTCNLW